ncbi:MAG: L-aspartate oxidase [Candidatus Dadabacteria bacterium]|nr:MAG: L-aspartate oxidase [Candidatus Dadabacteria bacterium]
MRQADILILGSGIAGLSLALRLAERHHVSVLTKGHIEDSNTYRAQGGIAAAIAPDDSVEAHIADTLKTGGGLSDPQVVRRIVAEGPAVIQDLVNWGVPFSRKDGKFDLGREGGHSFRRILHAGDITGAEIGRTLAARAREHPNIELFEYHMGVDLITRRRKFKQQPDACLGAYVLDIGSGAIEPWIARATVLATGGSGKVYLYTSNPDVATGDGLAMGWRAGCRAINMEFTQFHPTCLFHPQAKNFLISEAVRGEGAVLVNAAGKRFMPDVHPLAELAPRDIVARAIDAEIKRTGADCVFLDISMKPAEFIERRFPNLLKACLAYGFDMRKEPIPVVPAAHYQCGGLWSDLNGQTAIPGLYAIGEVAHTGLHGANRLASNSLLEGMVMARFAANHILDTEPDIPDVDGDRSLEWHYGDAVEPDEQVIVTHNWDELRRTMSSYVGIVRTSRRLERAERRMQMLAAEVLDYYWNVRPNKDLLELRNLVQVAWIIVQSAKRRRESRGLHYTLDYPRASDHPRDTVLDPLSHYP